MKKKPHHLGHAELHERLLLCAGTVGSLLERAPCPELAMFIGWALAPARGGARTHVTLFGVCSEHLYHRQGVEAELAERGFFNATLVPWEKFGEVLEMLEDSGLVKVA